MSEPIELFYAPTPNGWKITILCEEANVPYIIRPINLAKGDQFKPEFLALSPNNRMPAIRDPNVRSPNGEATTVFESGAIMWHICENYPSAAKYLPSHPHDRKEVLEWLFWTNANVGPMAGQVSHFINYAPRIAPDADHSYSLRRYSGEYDRLLSVLDRRLAQTGGFVCTAGYTIVDMALWPWIRPWKVWMKDDFTKYPNVRSWYEQLKARPGVVRGVEVMKGAARVSLPQGGKGQGGQQMTAEMAQRLFVQDGSVVRRESKL